MTKIMALLISSLILFSSVSQACEIEINVDESSVKKNVYSPGDEIVLVVKVIHNHRVCKLEISETKFDSDGFKILAATDWKKNPDGSFQRKVKVRIVGNRTGKLIFRATRKCTREDNEGVIRLECIPKS